MKIIKSKFFHLAYVLVLNESVLLVDLLFQAHTMVHHISKRGVDNIGKTKKHR